MDILNYLLTNLSKYDYIIVRNLLA